MISFPAILTSDMYNELYNDFVNASIFYGLMPELSNVFLSHWHAIEDIEEEERYSQLYKDAYLPEIAAQYRMTDGILRLDFNGVGINHDGGGFSTDISETCHWLTPFVKMPEDMQDLRYLSWFHYIFDAFLTFSISELLCHLQEMGSIMDCFCYWMLKAMTMHQQNMEAKDSL